MAALIILDRCCWVIPFLLFLSLCSFQLTQSQNLTCDPDDLRSLKRVFAGIGYEWTRDSSGSDCCDWLGVTCTSSRVTKLKLPGGSFTGKLTNSIGSLSDLQTLNLSINLLHGPLPESLFRLRKLEVLDLSQNQFSGHIPFNISLPELRLLDVSDNQLTGDIPSGICSHGSKLRKVKMADNYLTGSLLGRFGNCAVLQELSLGFNNLSGELPAELFGLKMLTALSLQDNRFTGFMNSGMGDGLALVRSDVSQNMFRTLPGNLSKLQFLIAHSNRFTGPIPSTVSNSQSIRVLNLRNNSFTGKIELNCSAMSSLVSLDLGFNSFTDFVPGNLVYCRSLTSINLDRNNFSGGIPESFKEFQSLSHLSISDANLLNISGALEVLHKCKNLTTLVLSRNFLGEELPSNPNLRFEKLRGLDMAGCKLSGSAPLWLKGSNNLQVLDFSQNQLNRLVPDWFGSFDSLFYLDLSSNSFSGEIPRSLTGLGSLITGNILFEEISPDFRFFFREIHMKGFDYKVQSFPPTLRLSNNDLTGPIWPEFGNLKELSFFDLKHNQLSGTIPSELSGMGSLESLDVSYNNLSGTIPSSLVALSFLYEFSVAYNHLHGNIPVGGQLGTFPNSSFEGNPGLSRSYSPYEVPFKVPHEENSSNQDDHHDFKTFAGVGFTIGFVFVFWFRVILHLCR